ncbi:hypothetical protein BJX70DRAFT_394676 [Aspergillus crustosus]
MNEPPDEPSETSSSSASSSSSSFPSAPVNHPPPPPLAPRTPMLILLAPSGTVPFITRYSCIIKKMQRDAHLVCVSTLEQLNGLLARPKLVNSIVGFIVTDGTIMDFDSEIDDEQEGSERVDGDNQALARALRSLLLDTKTNTNTNAPENPNHKPKSWTILHAFDFPAHAARHPFRFSKYFSSTFNLNWKICGATQEKIALEIGEPALRKLEGRVYRGGRYNLRGVFLEGVKEGDKVLRVARGATVRNGGLGVGGQPDCLFNPEIEGDWKDGGGDKGSKGFGSMDDMKAEETDSTAGEEVEYQVSRVEIGEADGSWTFAPPVRNDDDSLSSLDWGGGTEIQIVEPDVGREEIEWADDEREPAGESDDDDDEDNDEDIPTSSSSSNSDTELKENETILYINAPNQRGIPDADANADSEASLQPPSNKNKTTNRRKKKKFRFAQRIADCPVAIHKVRSLPDQAQGGQQVAAHGYVGFVGHIEDNRSMASLILGMCGVRNSRPLPASMRASLRGYLG